MLSLLSDLTGKFRPAIVFVLLMIFQGCARRPVTGIPQGINADQVLNAIEKRIAAVNDFYGRAQVTASVRGEKHSAIVYISYVKPGKFRTILKGAFGVVLAVITADNDSMTVYVPSLKGYFVTGKNDENIIEQLVPDVSFDFGRLTSLFTGTIPSSGKRENMRISVDHAKNRAELSFVSGDLHYRYCVEGAGLLLVEEELSAGGVILQRFEYRDYTPCGDTVFPREITVKDKDEELRLEFSSCSVNTGLTENELSFEIPSNADRLIIRRTEFQ